MSKYGKNNAKILILNVLTWFIVIIITVCVLGVLFFFGYPKYQEYSLHKYINSVTQEIHNCYDVSDYSSANAGYISQIESTAKIELERVKTREEADQVANNAIKKIQMVEVEKIANTIVNEIDPVETKPVEEKPKETKATLLSYSPSVGARIGISASSATSVIKQDGVNNSTEMLFDGKDDTSWQEGVSGYGLGESISASFYGEHKVKYIGFKLGNWKSDKYYYGNAKPRKLRIVLGNFAQSVEFTGERKEEWVEFTNPVSADSIRFEIEEVYPGTSWEDTCIAEIEIHEE